MLREGDAVRFLNEVGGGVVTAVDAKGMQVYVESEEGFIIGPTSADQCVIRDAQS